MQLQRIPLRRSSSPETLPTGNTNRTAWLLSSGGRSEKLAKKRFVVRPGEEHEFYALDEKLRYLGPPSIHEPG